MNKRYIKWILYIINSLIPKKKNTIYVHCMDNSIHDCYDIFNNSGSNLLKFTYEYIHKNHESHKTIFLECFQESRRDLYDELSKNVNNNNITLVPVYLSHNTHRFIGIMRRYYLMFRSSIWLVETGSSLIRNTKRQKVICLNYFISCKNDLDIGKNYRWAFLDKLVTTALLPSQIMSSSHGVKLDHCLITGFPRNDTILCSYKKNSVYQWIENEIGYRPEHIIVYAPTYRDYEVSEINARPLMGFDCCNLGKILTAYNSVLIFKLHEYQNDEIVKAKGGLIRYKESYDYTLYDLLSVADCLICDYSSVSFDFLLADKPIIYNLYDLELYKKTRGVSYDPYELFCPGPIVKNADELEKALKDVLEGKDAYKKERQLVRTIIHKYPDGQSTERTIKALESEV